MRSAGREVVALAALCAAMVTVLDAALLELQRGFFRGGFLAVDVATAWADRLVFAAGSLAIDVVWTAAGVLLAVAIAARLRWGQAARRLLAVGLGAGPLALASLVQYQILARLGDAFDVGLMFDLVGRRVGEFVAVSAAQLVAPTLVALVGLLVAVVTLRWVSARFPGDVRAGPSRRAIALWCVYALVATAGSTWLRVASDVQDNGLRRKPAGQALGTIVTVLSDVDRDGYGLLSRPPDPAPFDARVYPYAIDVPGNGIDENGIGGDLPIAPVGPVAASPDVVFAQRPPVVIVMLETFRADLLGAVEGGTRVTPVLDDLAARGASARQAYSHNGYTVQSRYHLFTGALVARDGAGTLLDDFRRNGYDTAFFSAQDESFGGAAYDVGAAQATRFYDARQDRDRRYTTFTTAGSLGVASSVVLERIGEYLAARDAATPLFLYVNFYDTHYPYWHEGLAPLVSDARVPQAEIVEARAGDVRRMYRNAAANVDRAVGALLQRVRAHVGREPVVIVLADHGESLFDDGFLGHGYVLDEAQTRIPVIAAGLPMRFCEPVGQSDIRGALLEALARPASTERPSVEDCGPREVFQYLGTIDRARQIAWRGATRRLTFDARAARVTLDDGAWQAPSALAGPARADWLALVHTWERLRLDPSPASETSEP